MKTFQIFIIAGLLLAISAFSISGQREFKDLTGKTPNLIQNLQQKGTGISDAQERFVLQTIENAYNSQGSYLYGNAVFIEQKLEDAYGGNWIVDIFYADGGVLDWGRGGLQFKNDQWLFYPNYNTNGYFYTIWVPGY